MANFDSMKSGAKNLFDKAVAKTGETVTVSKRYVEKTQINSKLNDLYQRLGKAEYSTQTGEKDESFLINELFTKIAEVRQELDEAERSLGEVTSIKCKNCGKKNSGQSTFCSSCGAPL